jgi:hypothetical protein
MAALLSTDCNKPLSNLYARMLQEMGVQQERFGSSAGVLSEIG